MDKRLKTALVVGVVGVTVYIVGGVILSSLGTAVGLGLAAGVGYIAYKKYKQVKSTTSIEARAEKQVPYKVERPALKEADADFMFSSNNQRKDL